MQGDALGDDFRTVQCRAISHGTEKCQNFFCTALHRVKNVALMQPLCENFFAGCGTVQNFSHGAVPREKIMLDPSNFSLQGAAPWGKKNAQCNTMEKKKQN